MKMRIDLAGLLANAAHALTEPRKREREMYVGALEDVVEHIRQVRKGDEATVKEFRDLYGLNPGDMLPKEGRTP